MTPPPRVSLRPAAITEIDEIADYIAQDNPSAAARFYVQLGNALDKLAAMPGMGSPRHIRKPALGGLRSWPIRGFRKYLIFYLPLETGGIDVLHVLHGARNVVRILKKD